MQSLLVINSSPKLQNSNTRDLIEFFVNRWKNLSAETLIVSRDIGENPPPHLDELLIDAFYTEAKQRTSTQCEAITLSDQLVDELVRADTIVIGSPMHNFTITSGLKSYIDHIARVGRTFIHTEQGKVGLLQGKKVFVISARGSDFSDKSPIKLYNFQDTYLKTALALVGLKDVTFINAEGVARSNTGIEQAKKSISNALNCL